MAKGTRGGKRESGSSESKFINSLVGLDMTNSDLQGAVEAYAIKNKLTPKQENELQNKVNTAVNKDSEARIEVAKQIAKKMGYSEAGYRNFLAPDYVDGYSKEQGKPYTLAELKKQLKNIK